VRLIAKTEIEKPIEGKKCGVKRRTRSIDVLQRISSCPMGNDNILVRVVG